MRIAIASLGDPQSVETWSGIPFSIFSGLYGKGHDMVPICLKPPREPWHYPWLRRYFHRTRKKWFLAAVEEQWLRSIGRQFDERVKMTEPDVVLVIHADWLAYTSFDCPACIVHDTTFASILNYYPSFTNLTQRSIRMGDRMYRLALQRSAAAVFSAEWASQSALSHYGAPPEKVKTIPFGANLEVVPSADQVESWIRARLRKSRCELLFVGTQWDRKGGPETLLFLEKLRAAGVPAFLTVVGCTPEIATHLRDFVRVEGHLSKRIAVDNRRLWQLFQMASALIVPSHAECFGCVYCEANAFGLPALGRDTGGVPEIIKNGVNGLLLRRNESIESFVDRWLEIWRNPEEYRRLSCNAFYEYKTRLNFDVFVNKLESVLVSIVEKQTLNHVEN